MKEHFVALVYILFLSGVSFLLMAKPLTDQQIEDLAAWYNSIPIQIAP